MSTRKEDAEHLLIRDRAAEWVCAMQEGDTDRVAFSAWLRQSPRHIEEFLFAAAAWKALDAVGPVSEGEVEAAVAQAISLAGQGNRNVTTLTPQTSPAARLNATRSRWRPMVAIAASAALIVCGWIAYSAFILAPTFHTVPGEQRTFRLRDGSVMYLNTSSRAKVRFSENSRDVTLLEGEALFDVAHDVARPFRVMSGATVIQAVGTQFNVRLRQGETRVSVIEGRVTVAGRQDPAQGKMNSSDVVAGKPIEASAGGAEMLGAGEEASVGRLGRIVKREARDVSDAVAWRTRHLVFRGETLETITAELNLYGPPRHFRVEGAEARNRRIAGTFSADDSQALVRFLERYDDLVVETTPEEFVIRDRLP